MESEIGNAEKDMPPESNESTEDWSEYPHYYGSPPGSPFHGFGVEEELPGRLLIKTVEVDGEEVFEEITREKRRGRPKGVSKLPEISPPINKKRSRAESDPADIPAWRTSSPTPTTPRSATGGTGSRPSFYLLGQAPTSLKMAKVPIQGAVLGRFLTHLEVSSIKEAAAVTRTEVKKVWLYHFGSRLVEGREIGLEEEGQESKKIVRTDRHIDDLIKSLHRDWVKLEKESRRSARANKDNFKNKEAGFMKSMLKPFNIAKLKVEEIMKESGIIDWVEEYQYLTNQLSEGQHGCPGPEDTHQKKRDVRNVTDKLSAIEAEKKEKKVREELLERKKAAKTNDTDPEVTTNNIDDTDYIVKPPRKKKKIDIMSKISITSDRANVSYQARTMIAASTANALGIDIGDTNISKTSGWRKAQEVRTKTSATIKEKFKCPDKCTVHWDGKGLTLKGNRKSNRVCVYLTGADANTTRKLLGVPETPSGTGADEAKVVTDMLVSWEVLDEVVGMVFDTTSCNTGAENGACKFVEEWRGSPILWLACRHHIAELHMMRTVQAVMGNTTDPGVKLFRRLKKEWSELEIDLDNLVKLDISSLDSELQKEAASVLAWAQEQLTKKTWPREDYKEMLELMIIYLGGTVPGFTFKIRGADSNARWMSKVIYDLKIELLSNVFHLSPEEKIQVGEIAKFSGLLYVKYWLQTPLPSSSARHDLDFMVKVLHYRLTNPAVAFAVLQSVHRHMWYLTPQLITLALADPGLEDSSKESIAKTLHSCKQLKISSVKPIFPLLPQVAGEMRKNMAGLVTSDSWLVFQLLGLEGTQDWLQTPASMWKLFSQFKKLQEFAFNLSVCNDIAERGIHLMTDFIKHCDSEDQRQALFQCVEFHTLKL